MTREQFDHSMKKLKKYFPKLWNDPRIELVWPEMKDLPSPWLQFVVNGMCIHWNPEFPITEAGRRELADILSRQQEQFESTQITESALENLLEQSGARNLVEAMEKAKEHHNEPA